MQRRIGWIGALAVASCIPLQNGAEQQFAEDTACPPDRLTVTRSSRTDDPPPTDVAADPERLRLWQQIQKSKRADDPSTYFEVAGCGKTEKMACLRDDDNGSRPWCIRALLPLRPEIAPKVVDNVADLASLPHVAEHYDCEATGGQDVLVSNCIERIRAMSHSLFIGAVIKSTALGDFAEKARANAP